MRVEAVGHRIQPQVRFFDVVGGPAHRHFLAHNAVAARLPVPLAVLVRGVARPHAHQPREASGLELAGEVHSRDLFPREVQVVVKNGDVGITEGGLGIGWGSGEAWG